MPSIMSLRANMRSRNGGSRRVFDRRSRSSPTFYGAGKSLHIQMHVYNVEFLPAIVLVSFMKL
jgi:hypothetical protein